MSTNVAVVKQGIQPGDGDADVVIQGAGAVVGVVVLYLVLVFGASESGEVVQLVTEDAQGEAVTTRLWVADTDGDMWLRAGDGTSGWYQRLTAHGTDSPATLIRGDEHLRRNRHP